LSFQRRNSVWRSESTIVVSANELIRCSERHKARRHADTDVAGLTKSSKHRRSQDSVAVPINVLDMLSGETTSGDLRSSSKRPMLSQPIVVTLNSEQKTRTRDRFEDSDQPRSGLEGRRRVTLP